MPATLEIEAIKESCEPVGYSSAQCYEAIEALGIEYGPGHQPIAMLYRGEGFVLARLVRPHTTECDRFVLHPGLLDGAVQAMLGLGADKRDPFIPFALERLEMIAPCRSEMWAVIRSRRLGSVRKVNVEFCDDDGVVCLRLHGLTSRTLANSVQAISPVADRATAGPREERILELLKGALSAVTKLPPHRIDARAPLEKYGIDSAMVIALTSRLEKTFGSLSKTLLFEFQTLEELAGYFLEAHPEKLGMQAANTPTRSSPRAPQSPLQLHHGSRAGLGEPPGSADREIAIIGLAGRYPRSKNLEIFWNNLRDGKDCITEIPIDRWDAGLLFSEGASKPGTTNSKWGGFLDDVDRFDASFFKISPKEAATIDPQERLFLECVYETLEDAGYIGEALGSDVGVYVGVMYQEYQLYGPQETAAGRPLSLFGSASSIANRVSFFFDFHGPSIALDTMCSSSLTALHLACESVRRGECQLAIAGGVNVSIHPNKYLVLGQGGFLSSNGRCTSFGVGGDGYVPGEGVGAILLKPLSRAVTDGDHIYGVIKGSAINHGGKTNGYTVPNPRAQATMIRRAYHEAGVDPSTVSYIEAHGTGTSLGDPIEIAALNRIFAEYTDRKQFCAIGSVKSNIGHCESAAGIAGVTKVLLQMQHRQIAPSLHSKALNPHIDFENCPFVVQQELCEWKNPDHLPRRAGISSFGAGGSNAHVIIEEYRESDPVEQPHSPPESCHVTLSARTAGQLREAADRLVRFLAARPSLGLVDVAFTLQTGRSELRERLGIRARSVQDLRTKLEAFIGGEETIADVYRGRTGREEEFADSTNLLEAWVNGVKIDWRSLYPEVQPRRISLPTYPFVRDRHWIEVAVPPAMEKRANDPLIGTLTLVPTWEATSPEPGHASPRPTDRLGIVGGAREQQDAIRRLCPHSEVLALIATDSVDEIATKLKAVGRLDHILWIAPAGSIDVDQVAGAQVEGVRLCFRTIKALLSLGYESQSLGWTLITYQTQLVHRDDRVDPAHSGLHGLIGSMAAEYPNWRVRRFDLEAARDCPLVELLSLPDPGKGLAWARRRDEWFKRQLVPLRTAAGRPAGKPGGVYVVIGGAGGIGMVWSEHMIRTHAARVIWIGRRARDQEIQTEIDRLSAFGPAPEYIAADACNRHELERAYQSIKARYGELHGLVHSAIVLSDQSLARMDEDQFFASYSAKVDVSICMAQVFGKEALDFVLFFSSFIAFADAAGQGNYAAGIAFEDAFAAHLNRVWSCAVRVMNWGYWGGVGIVSSADYREKMARIGLASIEPSEAMAALDRLLESPWNQMGLVKTHRRAALDGVVGPAWLESLRDTIPLIEPEPTVGEPPEKSRALDHLLGPLLKMQLKRIGCLDAPNAEMPILYKRWHDESRAICANITEEKNWTDWERAKTTWSEEPQLKAQMILLEAALRALPEILTGKRPATEVLFPKSSLALVEGIYKDNRLADYFNGILRSIVVDYVRMRLVENPSARLSILEIGAGTGGTSGMVLAGLNPWQANIQNYCYSDVSKAFLHHAEGEYGPHYPFLTYRIFDVTKPLSSQGIEAGGYDLVIAANVLHATPSIRRALRNAKAALKKNGLLLLNELSDNDLFTHLTFGLLEGWWLYEDAALRIPGCPGLSPQAWKHVLSSEGFESIRFPVQDAHDRGQQIIVARSDGLIRQDLAVSLERVPAPRETSVQVTGPRTDADRLVRETLVKKLSESLKMDPEQVDFDEPFAEYGVDSITGVQFVQGLNEALGIELDTTVLFDHRSVNKLAAHIVSERVEEQRVINRPMEAASPVGKEPIAIIGMSGRFAGSKNLDDLWKHLAAGRDLVQEVSRWNLEEVYAEVSGDDTSYCRHGSFLDEIDQFDPLFFNISGSEARYMDPQQRLFLEDSWAALEDAGYAGANIEGRQCGVYVGYNGGDYHKLVGDRSPAQAMWGNAGSVIPSRIAYHLDLKGPAVAVDTACSSALVAIHLACQGLWGGETEMAVAGGVFIQLTPAYYVIANRAGMLSARGRCHTFDSRADGFVPGEGVGAVVLKRLADAVRDGDQIYGVIRGSGINQDGATNGMTAPSAASQEQLIRRVYDAFGIDAGRIRVVEAHGTGTRLGDPIEVRALTCAFRQDTKKTAYCSIGSVKTNLGHTSAAAGIAGLFKLLLSLKNGQIPPSLHFESGNPAIAFDDSPFYVSTSLEPWLREGDTPLLAALSSFGFSGTNAHMVIEEAPTPMRHHEARPGYLIALAARTPAQLREQAERLIDWCETHRDIDCGNLSYSLAAGRKQFECRLAFVVRNVEELKTQLRSWMENRASEQVHAGEGRLQNASETDDAIPRCLAAGDDYLDRLATVAKRYAQGYRMPLDQLYAPGEYSRISLPTYPFARDRYWVPSNAPTAKAPPHPLIHRKSAGDSEQLCSSTFTGREFFLVGHVVQGKSVLPGVAYLEMVREATRGNVPNACIRISNVAWPRPLTVEDRPVQVKIRSVPANHGQMAFEIFSESDGKPVVHSQGVVESIAESHVPAVDLPFWRSKIGPPRFASAACYETLKNLGIDYGPSFQSIQEIFVNNNHVLARLTLPTAASSTRDQFVLHPSIMDGALQSIVGFGLASNTKYQTLVVPFAMQEVNVFGPCTSSMWALVRKADDGGNRVERFDIDVCDDAGNVRVQIRGFSVRALEDAGTVLLTPSWERVPVARVAPLPSADHRVVVIGEFTLAAFPRSHHLAHDPGDAIETIQEKLETFGPIDHIWWVAPARESSADGVLFGFRLIKALLALGYGTKRLAWTVITFDAQRVSQGDPVNPAHAGLQGFLGSTAKEYSNWNFRLVDLEADANWPLAEITSLPPDRDGTPWLYRNRQWYRPILLRCSGKTNHESVYRHGGVYVVIGGAGGIGSVWSEYMIRSYRSRVIWIGRRAKDESIENKLKEFSLIGPAPQYISADATDGNALERAYKEIKSRHPTIDGVVHSAIVLSDGGLALMTEDRFRASLSAKADICVNIASVFKDEPLDFVLFFSAMNSFLKPPGQSNYAAGCAFEDAYAHSIASQWRCAVKVMNWGYWGSVGVVSAKWYQDRMAQAGIGSLEPAESMAQLEQLLAGPLDQMGMIKTTRPLALPGVDLRLDESIVVYPRSIPSVIDAVKHRSPDRDVAASELEAKESVYQQQLERELAKLLWTQLQSLEFFAEKATPRAEVATNSRLLKEYSRWLEASIEFLVHNGYLHFEDDVYTVIQTSSFDPENMRLQWNRQKELWLNESGPKHHLALVESTVFALPDILTGRQRAIDLMFPDGSVKLVEAVYRNNPVSDHFNRVLCDAVMSCIDARVQRDASCRIRILEIGAGTGSTSAMLMAALERYPQNIEEFCYTDISQAFLLRAEREYGTRYPYLSFRIVDVEKPLVEQGIPVDAFDFVIAANVFHATRNICRTLRNAKAALKANGVLVLNELSAHTLFSHLSFALLDGWWLHEDTDIRISGCPGLSMKSWEHVLGAEGYRSVVFPAQGCHELGQQIVAAESDGVVRCKPSDSRSPRTQVNKKEPMQPRYTGATVTDQMLDEHVRAVIREGVSEVLEIDEGQIQNDRSFSEYGVDSISAVQLVNCVNRRYAITVETTALFDYNNVNELTQHLIQEHRAGLLGAFQEERLTGDQAAEKAEPEAAASEERTGFRRVVVERPGEIKDLKIIESTAEGC